MKTTGLVKISFQTTLLPFPPTLEFDHCSWQITVLVSRPDLASQTEKYWDFYLLVVIQDQKKLSWGGGGGGKHSSSYE